MIVINKSPTLTHLPWKTKKTSGVFSFHPGNNNINAEVLQAVMQAAGEDVWKAHYGNFLVPVGKPSETTQTVNLADLAARDFIDLIEGTIDADKLAEYRLFEEAGEQRKTVLAAIDKQAAAIDEIEKKKKAAVE